jgi:hypothetical protein
MLYYRLYFMNAAGSITSFSELEAPDDEAAIAQARAHQGEQPIELWCQSRSVMRFEGAERQKLKAAE